jgi:nucleoside-triphosphate--adenylate kinase
MLRVLTTKLDLLHNKVSARFNIIFFSEYNTVQHWILDGFPRTLRQGELLDSHLQ